MTIREDQRKLRKIFVASVGKKIKEITMGQHGSRWVHDDGSNSPANESCEPDEEENKDPIEEVESEEVKTEELPVEVEFNTDLMGLMRFKMQSVDIGTKILYLIFYIGMVFYTCMFTFYYLKRVLNMAFLTLISPLVALTYPIDKMRDGKAQAFDLWIKEYTFNALLQPFHLIIYTIFVGSAIELAAHNPLFAIVALAFITPAEKILRKFFGFEKATTAGTLGSIAGIAGGAAIMNKMQHALSPKKASSGSKPGKGRTNVEGSKPSVGEAFGEGVRREALDESKGEGKDNENDLALERYHAEGFGKNANGEYFNPYTSEYDSEYDPHNDNSYSQMEAQQEFQPSNDEKGVEYGNDVRRFVRHGVDGAKSIKTKASMWAEKKWAKVPKPIRKTARTLGGVAKGVGNVALQTGLKAGKAALKAAPGAILGIGAGIAGDELGDIWKYTAAGATLSSTIGSSAVAQAGSFIANAYNSAAHGSVEAQLEQRRREFQKDEANKTIAKLMNPNASNAEIKGMLEKASYYDSIGIEGKKAFKAAKFEKDLKNAMIANGKQEDDAEKMAQKQAAVIADYASRYDKKDLMDKGKVSGLRDELSKRLGDAGLKGKEKVDTVEMIVSNVKAFNGINNNY